MVATKRERAMKRLIVAAAALASLAGCWSWHPSNDGPPRAQEGRSAPAPVYTSPPPAYVAPAR
jgi:hypothetical protein